MKKLFFLTNSYLNLQHILILLYGVNFSLYTMGQDRQALYANSITISDIKGIIEYLADDKRMGRDVRGEELNKVAEYLANRFNDFGFSPLNGKDYELEDGYFQKFPLIESAILKGSASFGTQVYLKHGKDFIFLNSQGSPKKVEGRLVFVGDGSEESLDKLNIEGAIVLVKPKDGIFSINKELLIKGGAKAMLIMYDKADNNYRSFLGGFGAYLSGQRIDLKNNNGETSILGAVISRSLGFKLSSCLGAR